MGVRFACARALGALSTWGLRHIFRRPAANFPGQIGLAADPQLIAHLRLKLQQGSICVVGTNGKTTTTNLLADALERTGARVACNRTGANLSYGVATALLHAEPSDWGVFESDELWLAHILPQLRSDYVLLLNLFRDQLDRVGEIARVQDSIVRALESSPNTVLLYNADDPLCAAIASKVANTSFAFGIAESMGLAQNTVSDTTMCQHCSAMMSYDFRQYGQLGSYRCPNCGFARPTLDFAAKNVQLTRDSLSFDFCDERICEYACHDTQTALPSEIRAAFGGSYMVYNLLACAVGASALGCAPAMLQAAIDAFDPQNGRLQSYSLHGRRILLNLAKNPTGFNQNLKLVAQDTNAKAVAFFINDKEADGHDVSWLWDVDFEELAASGTAAVYASGIRGHDMQVRLKYADIASEVLPDANAVLDRIEALPPEIDAYVIANYTALPAAKAALDRRATTGTGSLGAAAPVASAAPVPAVTASATPVPAKTDIAPAPAAPTIKTDTTPAFTPQIPLVIAHLFPDLLNLYGDGGNVRVLEQRLRWRGIPVEVRRVHYGESIDLHTVDLVFLGGGPDREQKLASAELMRMKEALRAYVEDDGVLLAICGGYQILGHEWLLGNDTVEGLGVLDLTTRRPGTSADRLIDHIVLSSELASRPVVGYENHAGRTYLGEGIQPFGQTISKTGCGNNEEAHSDGVQYRSVIGTYLHGPLLAKNPEVADWLLARAAARFQQRTGQPAPVLTPLDDREETAANETLCRRFVL